MTAKLEVLKKIAEAALTRAVHEAQYGTPEAVDTWTSVAIHYAQAVERDTPATAVNDEDKAGIYRMTYTGGFVLDVIKILRNINKMALKEAKDFVEGNLTTFLSHSVAVSLANIEGVRLTRVN